jgi:hypothetical protein
MAVIAAMRFIFDNQESKDYDTYQNSDFQYFYQLIH